MAAALRHGRMLAAPSPSPSSSCCQVNFDYWAFAGLLLMNGLAMGAFAAPNRAGVMNSLPAAYRGVGRG